MGKNKIIGLTLGDPAGIGPEIVEQALAHFAKKQSALQLRVIGSAKGIKPSKPGKKSGRLALGALEESVRLLRQGKIHAVVNGPVSKKYLSFVGFPFPGQTEFYAKRVGLAARDVTMMLTCPRLTVALVSTHCSLRESIRLIDAPRIVSTALRTVDVLGKMGIRKPRIAVCGLNPHAGESGLFGDEEQKHIIPAIRQLKKTGRAKISGPHSPDAIFRQITLPRKTKSKQADHADAVICMYHDQGLIPLKLLGFETGANLTLGLPFWRGASVHGTAFDIAGKGVASPKSMIGAIQLIYRLLC